MHDRDGCTYVAFRAMEFAFAAEETGKRAYIDGIDDLPHPNKPDYRGNPLKARRVSRSAWRRVMMFLSRLFSHRKVSQLKSDNIATALERQRLARTMPGQTAAMAGTRLGVLVN